MKTALIIAMLSTSLHNYTPVPTKIQNSLNCVAQRVCDQCPHEHCQPVLGCTTTMYECNCRTEYVGCTR
jgi:hypothetical protein